MFFPKFVYMTKNTPFFSNFARFCTPKRCTRVQCLVLKNNPNYVNFWTSLIPPLTIQVPPLEYGACELIIASERGVLWTEIFKFWGLRAKIWAKIEAVEAKISIFFFAKESVVNLFLSLFAWNGTFVN